MISRETLIKHLSIDISDVPANVGVFPVEFDSDEDAIEFINNTAFLPDKTAMNRKTVFDYYEDILRISRAPSWFYATDYDPIGIWTVNPDTGAPGTSYAQFNVFAELLLDWTSSGGVISAYREAGVSLTGITLGMDLSDKRCTVNIASSTRADLTGRATLNYYLVVNGLIKLYSKPISYSWSFYM